MVVQRAGVATNAGYLTEKFASIDRWHNVLVEHMTLAQFREAATQCYQIGKIIRENAAQKDTVAQLVHLYPDMPALGFQFNRKAEAMEDCRGAIVQARVDAVRREEDQRKCLAPHGLRHWT